MGVQVRVTMQTLVTNALRLVRSAQSTPIRCIKTAPAPVSAFACAPGSPPDVPVKNLAGEQVDTISLDPDVFGLPMRRDIVHRVATWQRACRRQGGASAKSRGQVRGSTRKLYSQRALATHVSAVHG